MYRPFTINKWRLPGGSKSYCSWHYLGQNSQYHGFRNQIPKVKAYYYVKRLSVRLGCNYTNRRLWRGVREQHCIVVQTALQHNDRSSVTAHAGNAPGDTSESLSVTNTNSTRQDEYCGSMYSRHRIGESEMTLDRDEEAFSSGYMDAFNDDRKQSRNQKVARHEQSFVATRPKVDLSHLSTRRREAVCTSSQLSRTSRALPSDFRDNSGMRWILGQYMRHIQPFLGNFEHSVQQNQDLDQWLVTIFSKDAIRKLEQRGYNPTDIVSWSWIFSAGSTRQAVRRYATLARQTRNNHRQLLPLFIPLQLLRAPSIDRDSLALLVHELEDSTKYHSAWGKDSAAILLIRLVRHARLTAVSLYERIARLASIVLPIESHGNLYGDIQRFSHFYNRFLSLLALPVAKHPFLSMGFQQRAQLMIARYMMESELNIQLNREGYRALARLQLMHQKTVDEQRWSSVKGPSWPPWRRDELGIDARNEYPGRDSRVAKVIKRLLEAGYGPESMEKEAQVLAGWDTDKSPTIQLRRILNRRPLSWLKRLFDDKTEAKPEVDHHTWAARVAATRSVREAWVCFYSYMDATMNSDRQLRVYHEMFYKLFARVQQTDQRYAPSPGDGKEVFADPTSPRDLVYVPKEPPTINELYAQMLQDGVRPAGRLLAGLLDNAQSLLQGFDYLQQSTMGEVKKEVLLHPENYPRYFIRNIFSALPDYLLASYIGMLTKRFKTDEVELYWPGSRSIEEAEALPRGRVKPLHFGMALMQIWQPTYVPAYHAILEGLCTQAKMRRSNNSSGSLRLHSYHELWKMARDLIELMEEKELSPDLICFRKFMVLIRNNMIRAPSQFSDEQSNIPEPIFMAKKMFAGAVGGQLNGGELLLNHRNLDIGQQPYWKDIEALLIVFGFHGDFAGTLRILEWLNAGRHQLDCVDDGSYKMQQLMCATRVAMEPKWIGSNFVRPNEEQMQRAKQLVHRWNWPEDIDMKEYLKHHSVWIGGIKAVIKLGHA